MLCHDVQLSIYAHYAAKMNFGRYFESFRLLKVRSTMSIKPVITDSDIYDVIRWDFSSFFINIISMKIMPKQILWLYNFNSKNKHQTFRISTLICCIYFVVFAVAQFNQKNEIHGFCAFCVWLFYVCIYIYGSICNCNVAQIFLSTFDALNIHPSVRPFNRVEFLWRWRI